MTLLQDPPPTTKPRPAPVISERLAEPLRIVAGRATFLFWLRALLKLTALIAAVWLFTALVLGSGRQLPVWLGIVLALAAWATVLIGGFKILRPLFTRKSSLASAARLADDAMPDSEERLSSAIELSQETDPTFQGSPELVAVLMRQAEVHADTMDPGTVISARDVLRWLGAAAVLLLAWFVLLVVLTPNMLLGMQRLFSPWTVANALPEPIIEVDPGDAVLAQGDKLTIKVEVKPPEGLSLDTGHKKIDKATLVQHFTDTTNGFSAPDISIPLEATELSEHRKFQAFLPNLQHSFTYQILVDGGSDIGPGASPTYTVSVQTRPAVADIEVLYTYPAYTHLQPKTTHSHDGAIEALTGTKVHITLHTTEPVKTARLTLDNDGYSAIKNLDLASLPDAPTGNGLGQAAYGGPTSEFTLNKSTQYHLTLANSAGRDNPDAQSRPITALIDQPPRVEIKSSDPKSTATPASALKVRPDDAVPIRLVATDDFGITKLQAIVQVDNANPVTFDLPMDAGDTLISTDWTLHLDEILKSALLTGNQPRRVSYQFKATDNRDPGPQEGLSPKQFLDLDKAAPPLAQRLDTAAAKDLASAVQRATDKLKAAQSTLADLQKSDTDRTLAPPDQTRAANAQRDLMEARTQLTQAADQADASRLTDQAKRVRDIAGTNVKAAEEQTVKTSLAADQPTVRRETEASAQQNIKDALDRLNGISKSLNDTSKDQPLAQALERLAQEQRKLADDLAKNPTDPALLAQQQKLQKDLDQLIKDHPELQKSAEDASKARLKALAQKVQQLEQTQDALNKQLDNANSAPTVPAQAKDLAAKQEQLNKDISQFSQQNAPAFAPPNSAKPPEPAKLDPIVKELQAAQLDSAARDQRSAASTLDQSAAQLQNQQKNRDDAANSAPRQKLAEQAAKDAQQAADDKQQAQKLAQQIQSAKDQHNPPTRPGDAANQQAVKLADQIKRDAQQLTPSGNQNPAQKTAAQSAAKDADSARQAAQRGEAETAQQRLAQAANELAQAAQAQQTAAGPTPAQPATPDAPPSPESAQQAQQLKSLADRQRDLADQSARLAQSQQDAANTRTNSAATADRQRALADKIADTTKEAQDLQQQTKGPAPQLSDKVAQAQQALDKAAQAQRDAAQSTRSQNISDSAAKQSQSADRLADAEEALTGQRPQKSNSQSSPPSRSQPPTANNAPPSSPQNGSPGQPPANGNPGQSASAPPSSPSSPPGASPPSNGSTPSSAGQPSAGSPGGSPAPGQSPSGAPSSPSSAQAGSSQDPNSSAGQAVQGARSAQSQAMGGNSAAARQAADQLDQASQQLARNSQGASPSSSGSPGAGNNPGSSGAGAGGGTPGSTPGGTAGGSGPSRSNTGSGGGIKITMDGRPAPAELPAEVKEVGIAPSDWARLPPDMQDQLLHSAQQPGPPAYRDMIKNYYSRIARMQAQSPTPHPAPAPEAH